MLAIDYGRRRIGIAASDPSATIASPHSSVRNTGDPLEPPDDLVELVQAAHPSAIVVGIPLRMDGSEGEMALEAREFGRRLARRTGVPAIEWDERLTSVQARRTIVEAGGSRKRRRREGTEDMLAATHLLRGYLDARGGGSGEPES